MNLGELVKDWGGFERLIASLNETGEVTVEHNVSLPGRSGAARQIDVLIKHKQGLYEHLIVAECKYWNSPVERLHVDALATTVREVGASKGVIFSTKGFQAGAITQAAHDNIELFTVRDLTDEEWGLPGRIFDIYLHVTAISIGKFSIKKASSILGLMPASNKLEISFGNPQGDTKTPVEIPGHPEKFLEEFLSRVAHESAQKVYQPQAIKINEGYEGSFLIKTKVDVVLKAPMRVALNGGLVFISEMSFDIGLKTSQSRILIDRAENFQFVLAVEDCVRKTVTAARRRKDEGLTEIVDISKPEAVDEKEIVKNGSVLSVWMKGLYRFDDFMDIAYGKLIIC